MFVDVRGGEVTDYTVLGDMVNVAARLQGEAGAVKFLSRKKPAPESRANFPTLSAASFR